MNKFFKYLICLLSLTLIVGCSSTKKEEDENNNDIGISDAQEPANILCPSGAPALAFVSEYESITTEGKIDFVDGSDALVAELSKADSEYDIIVAPINVGAKLIETDQTDYRLSSVITWGNLYYVGTDEESLQRTGELALFGQGAVPEKIVEATNIETTLTPTYYSSATLVQQQLLSGNAVAGLLAEPLASATIAKGKQEGIPLQIITDLQTEYGDGNGYPQAAIFVKNNSSHSMLFDNIDVFTNDGYTGLQKYLEDIGVETLNLPSVELVVSSMERQNVHYKPAKDCKEEITEFLQLFGITFSDEMLAS
ncbi:MAG: hypothetical protein ACK5LC_03395 [Coprobacillaceae bacterium]